MKKRITQEELTKSYKRLEIPAEFDLDFICLTVFAAVICTCSFRMNNTAVIIGAVILHPILLTIVASGASLFRRRWKNFL